MKMTIRQASKHDVEQAVPLMFSSGPGSYRYVFSINEPDEALDFLKFAFAKGHGEFGYRHHYVAIINHEIVGIIGYRRAKDSIKYTLSAIKNIISFYGWRDGLKVLYRGLRFEHIVKPPKPGCPCIHNLGVNAEIQGQGIGTALISFAEQKAQQDGKRKICLDVAESNPQAKALYQRLAFCEMKHNIGQLRSTYGAVGNSYFMVKQLCNS